MNHSRDAHCNEYLAQQLCCCAEQQSCSAERLAAFRHQIVIITSLAGIFLGLPVGALLGYLIMRLTEQSDLQMVRSVDVRTMIFSALITALFAAFINGMALRKIKDLKLSDLA